MQRRLSFTHELFSNPDREGKISQSFTVEMADLASAHVKEDHAVRKYIDPHMGPGCDLLLNLAGNSTSRHLQKFGGRMNDAFFRATMLAGRR